MRNHGVIMGLLGLAMSVTGCADPGGDDAQDPVGAASQAATTCVTIRRGTLGDVTDARLRADSPDTNFGARDTWVTGAEFTERLALVQLGVAPTRALGDVPHLLHPLAEMWSRELAVSPSELTRVAP